MYMGISGCGFQELGLSHLPPVMETQIEKNIEIQWKLGGTIKGGVVD